ncbi:XRE family transcriptional regulator [Wolbachia endosymbiont of Ctenocephalides felis wCfeT]|uniref:XRE family transcriptional regulator n=1 Tax=Wolbachia endosymbiont of Ctenocephalides felis wCfeT TaxID=2732593 RepID=UPI001C552640|nr:XRE family transcriptional regulator [Wolbachia endosymbiont of Ctenocephalides felis wCfeT]
MYITKAHTKETLIQMINKAIDDNKWSSKETAHILQTALSDISCIRRSKAASFSLARLLTFLVRLDCRVTISINSKETIKQIEYFELAATSVLT